MLPTFDWLPEGMHVSSRGGTPSQGFNWEFRGSLLRTKNGQWYCDDPRSQSSELTELGADLTLE